MEMTKKGVDESIMSEIVRRITSAATPDKIILFGSAARGEMTRDSDIDLLVIERDVPSPRGESVRLGDTLAGLGFPFDVIVVSTAYFEGTKNIIGGVAYPAHKYGKVIYDAG